MKPQKKEELSKSINNWEEFLDYAMTILPNKFQKKDMKKGMRKEKFTHPGKDV